MGVQRSRVPLVIFETKKIITLKKCVDVEHILIAKKFDEEVNSPVRRCLEKQTTKKRPINEIFEFFFVKDPLKKGNVQQK